jgi:hypothetical protein
LFTTDAGKDEERIETRRYEAARIDAETWGKVRSVGTHRLKRVINVCLFLHLELCTSAA